MLGESPCISENRNRNFVRPLRRLVILMAFIAVEFLSRKLLQKDVPTSSAVYSTAPVCPINALIYIFTGVGNFQDTQRVLLTELQRKI